MKRRRRLLPQHLDAFPWLAVSRHPGTDGAFCISGVLFAAGSTTGGTHGQAELPGKLATVPLVKFNNLTGKDDVLPRHQNTKYHQHSIVAVDDFKCVIIDRSQPHIHSSVDEAHKREVKENQNILKAIIDSILTCARQNIPLRGHRGEIEAVSPDGSEPACVAAIQNMSR